MDEDVLQQLISDVTGHIQEKRDKNQELGQQLNEFQTLAEQRVINEGVQDDLDELDGAENAVQRVRENDEIGEAEAREELERIQQEREMLQERISTIRNDVASDLNVEPEQLIEQINEVREEIRELEGERNQYEDWLGATREVGEEVEA
jgi:chromosome segregation ATPase